jgi:hypothetical protein
MTTPIEKESQNNLLLGNVSHNDLTMIRNEFLVHIKKLQKELSKKIEEQNNTLSSSLNLINSKINEFSKNNSSLIEKTANITVQLDKLDDIENFKKKAESQLITHEVKINNITKDLADSKFKYDKIFIDNLTVPGFIGPQCQYKTLGEYLLSDIQIMNKLSKSREKIKKGLNELQINFEDMNKNFLININSTIQSCNDYSDQKNELLEKALKIEIHNITEKITDVRMQIMNDIVNFEKKNNEMKSEFDKIILIINDFESKYKGKVSINDNIKDNNNDNKNKDKIKINNKNNDDNIVRNENNNDDLKIHLNKKYNELNEEFNKIKKDFSNIFEEIKNMKNKFFANENYKKSEPNIIYKNIYKNNKIESYDSDKIDNIDYEKDFNKKINDYEENNIKEKVRKLLYNKNRK